MRSLRLDFFGEDVIELQKKLIELGFKPGAVDGNFGPATQAAVIAFQRSEGLLPDGIVGVKTLRALSFKPTPEDIAAESVLSKVTVSIVSQMFPLVPIDNIKAHLPHILTALQEQELTDRNMVLMALSTIRAETASFKPIDEFISRFNTSPGGEPFDLYDNRKDLGNKGSKDGDSFKGRGFIQLTGRSNYKTIGSELKINLIKNPELANESIIASQILALFLKEKELSIKEALMENDLRTARRLVNGGNHGLDEFTKAFRTGERLLPPTLQIAVLDASVSDIKLQLPA